MSDDDLFELVPKTDVQDEFITKNGQDWALLGSQNDFQVHNTWELIDCNDDDTLSTSSHLTEEYDMYCPEEEFDENNNAICVTLDENANFNLETAIDTFDVFNMSVVDVDDVNCDRSLKKEHVDEVIEPDVDDAPDRSECEGASDSDPDTYMDCDDRACECVDTIDSEFWRRIHAAEYRTTLCCWCEDDLENDCHEPSQFLSGDELYDYHPTVSQRRKNDRFESRLRKKQKRKLYWM